MRELGGYLSAVLQWMLTGAVACGCAGSSLQGGRLTAPETEPVGKRRDRYVVADCTDASGARIAADSRELDLVWLGSGSSVLLERRDAFDTVVIYNRVPGRLGHRFQLVLDAGKRAYLREYRLPTTGAGRLVVADRFTIHGKTHDFEAAYEDWVYSCALARRAPAQRF